MDRTRSGPAPVERATGTPPTDPEWRADALAQSRHSRLDEVLIEPLEDRDVSRAAAVCGEITRRALADFAPALTLLSFAERRRVQALAAFGLTLFDFARQSSLEGEKLAQINRWCYDLDLTLAGSPPGQPVFVLLSTSQQESPWSEAALDEIASCARRRAVRPRATTTAQAEADSLRLAGAVARALLPAAPDEAIRGFAALLRVQRLLGLGEDRRRHQAGLARADLPEDWDPAPPSDREVASAVRQECQRLEAALRENGWLKSLPPRWRRAARYALLGARRLVQRCDALGSEALAAPPRLGPGERLGLLLRARWLRA